MDQRSSLTCVCFETLLEFLEVYRGVSLEILDVCAFIIRSKIRALKQSVTILEECCRCFLMSFLTLIFKSSVYSVLVSVEFDVKMIVLFDLGLRLYSNLYWACLCFVYKFLVISWLVMIDFFMVYTEGLCNADHRR